MTILIFGRGWLGSKINAYFDGSVLSPVDITDYLAVRAELERVKPDAVINAAGKTGRPNIDWCEEHKLETLSSNVTGPQVLLRATHEFGVHFTHLSSGCIYEGDGGGAGWREVDPPNFFGSFYSRTKIMAETALREFPVLIARIRMPFDDKPSERNLINKLLKYDQVISVPNSITVIPDLLKALSQLICDRRTGIYNIVNPGALTHPEILEMYRKTVDSTHTYQIIPLEALAQLTKTGRSNCVLNTDKLAEEGVSMRESHQAVQECLNSYAAHTIR